MYIESGIFHFFVSDFMKGSTIIYIKLHGAYELVIGALQLIQNHIYITLSDYERRKLAIKAPSFATDFIPYPPYISSVHVTGGVVMKSALTLSSLTY